MTTQADPTLAEIVQTDILVCAPDVTLVEAAQRMRTRNCSSIVVVEAERAVGIWTEHDATRLDFASVQLAQLTIGQVMSQPVKTISVTTGIREAALRFREEGVRHFVVETEGGALAGIVTQTDVTLGHGVEHYLTLRSVTSAMRQSLFRLPGGLSLAEAVQRMRAARSDAAIVDLEDGRHGIITERDLVRLIALRQTCGTVGEVASVPLVTVTAGGSLLAARNLLEREGIRHLGVVDEAGEVCGLLSIADILAVLQNDYVQNLTATLRQRDAQLERSRRDLLARNHVLDLLAAGTPLKDLLHEVALLAESVLDDALCSILLLDGECKRLCHAVAPHLPEAYIAQVDGIEIGPEVGSCGAAAWHGQRVVAEDISSHPYWSGLQSLVEPFGLRACWSEPVIDSSGEVVGTLAIYFRTPRAPTESELELLHDTANLASIAVERQRAQEALRLAAVAFETSEAIMVTDSEGVIVRVNHAFSAMTGYSAAEALGRNIIQLRSEHQEPALLRRVWRSLRKRGGWEGELWNRRRDGTRYAEWLSIKPVVDQAGVTTHFVATFFDITERKRMEEQIERMAYFDALTGLPNRRLFLDRLSSRLVSGRRHGHVGAVLFIDLDNFKMLNDVRGHEAGDRLLIQVASRLTEALRDEDTVARFGGDEFVVLLPELATDQAGAIERALSVAEKLRARIARPYPLGAYSHEVGASIGLTVFPKGSETVDDLLKEADTAMYRAKEAGRNAVRYFEPLMQVEAEARFGLEHDLRSALARGEFELFLQPQFDGRAEAVGAEALLRWNHPERGTVSPGLFIPVAENSGQIVAIGEWVLAEACRMLHRLAQLGIEQVIAVNISPRQFHRADFVERIKAILQETGAPPHQLLLEVTENVALDDIDETVRKMQQLRDIGVRFSLDDFGTGYSSLAYLKRLPVNEIKIDRSFVQDLARDSNDAALVQTILAVARHLSLGVVAEGVETHAQHHFLHEQGCPTFQGFLFARPMAASDYLATLR